MTRKNLISFYKDNPTLWNALDQNYRNKAERSAVKKRLGELVNDKYSEDLLEKTFHSLRTTILREHKNIIENENQSSKWKFYKEMELILVTNTNKKKTEFEADELENLIDFYHQNEPLWKHHLKEYRDRNLREALLSKLSDQFEGKFTAAEIKQQWHNLLTSYKREKQREESSKTSGSGTSDVYVSNWDYYDAMTFTDDTHEMDESVNSISPVVPEKKKKHNEKTSSRDEELPAKRR